MSSDLIVAEKALTHAAPIFGNSPRSMVAHATEVANALSDVIEQKKLFTDIQGRKYVRVEGWQVLGSMLGYIPEEVPGSVREISPGVWEATVEIRSIRDGVVVGRGSAICSHKERRWQSADDYARRSMAVTRAQGKAYRTGFGWIVNLAGYEATPEEEMPGTRYEAPKREEISGRQVPQHGAAGEVFSRENQVHMGRLESLLESRYPGVAKARYLKIADALEGCQMNFAEVERAIERVNVANTIEAGVFA